MDQSDARTVVKKLDLEALGKELTISSVANEMRFLICPRCHEQYIVQKQTTHAKCKCGVTIEMEERWYE